MPNAAMDLVRSARAFAFNSRDKFPLWIIPLFLAAEALLSAAIILRVPCSCAAAAPPARH